MNASTESRASNPMNTSDLEYDLPSRLIATRPAEPRDSARLLVLSRSDDRMEHVRVRDLPEFLQPGDAMVFNITGVLPARLIGRRTDTGGRIEALYLSDVESDTPGLHWLLMMKAGGRLRAGQCVEWLSAADHPSGIVSTLVRQIEGEWMVRTEPGGSTPAIQESIGRTPLPPYILNARSESDRIDPSITDEQDRLWYQTVYASAGDRGSVAAPTAGLHFTTELLASLSTKGINRLDVTLHVGPGTFKPISVSTIAQHRMHAEAFTVPAGTVSAIRAMKTSRSSERIIAVGTTTVRTLESLPVPLPEKCGPIAGMTDLMIAPPYDFQLVDGLLTNFHLPRSTLLALVGAMVGLDRLKAVYREAIRHEYRFYSYGDAMLILP